MSISDRVAGKINRLWIHLLIFLYNLWKSIAGLAQLKSRIMDNAPSEGFESMYSPAKREVEIFPSDMNLDEGIFSCYFIYKADPILGNVRNEPSIDYIAPWYRSIEKTGVRGIIIHDGIDENFISRYQTDKILFRKYLPGQYSIFEERWFAYYMFLAGTNIRKAFFTDINDVYITKDPFPLIENDLALYIGKDNANKIKDSGWLLTELKEVESDANIKAPFLYTYQYAYNAGVVGGSRNVLLFLMSKAINYIILTRTNTHKDMTILNLCIHQHFFPRIDPDLFRSKLHTPEDDKRAAHKYLITGYPFNSDFKKNQMTSDAYFIHK